jgi:pimeloyl-ACP methyl ester carboxylesterase
MDVILVPGFWLRGDSWDAALPPIEAAGHRTHPITRPGLGHGDDPAAVSLADQVAAIVAEIDRHPDPVVLVGHSGAGPIVYGAADQRIDRVARIVYVDTWPLPEGMANNDELPVVDGAVPLPDWAIFDDADVRDLDEGLRARMRADAVRSPQEPRATGSSCATSGDVAPRRPSSPPPVRRRSTASGSRAPSSPSCARSRTSPGSSCRPATGRSSRDHGNSERRSRQPSASADSCSPARSRLTA